ncbi:MAG: hypothetical protein ACLPPV_04355 [Candidatus Korobacteraceae bacterium]
MQGIATALVTLGGLVLSISCAVLLEELFLGGLFRLFFAPRPVAGQKRGSGRVR